MAPKIKEHKCKDHEIVFYDGISEEHICSICGKNMGTYEPYYMFE